MRNKRGTITVLCGVSGSGKSTLAHKMWEQDPLNTTIVSRDKLREMMFGYGEHNIQEYYKREDVGKLERLVTRAHEVAVHEGVELGKHVIIDNTHLKLAYIKPYLIHNVEMEILVVKAPLGVCLSRNGNRTRQVNEEVIYRQYQQLKTLQEDINKDEDFSPDLTDENIEGHFVDSYFTHKLINLKNNPDNPPVVVVDLDGCLAKKGDRDIYDTSKCDLDILIEPVFNALPKDKPIIICTGRDDKYRHVTEKWLADNNVNYSEIHFRKYGDQRPDWQVKAEMWADITERWYVDYMLDDRNNIVVHSRALGFKVFQVEWGKF